MSSNAKSFVIIGGGLAAGTAAATLREAGFDGKVIILGHENEEPYNRPPLSKEYLRGEPDSASHLPVHEPAFYREQDIELRLGTTVVALEPGAREVVLEGGERVAFDNALLATGSEPRRIEIPGAELDAVHTLRTHGDSDALSARIRASSRIVVIGAGWIGCEVAASARTLGTEVTVVAPNTVPLAAMLGEQFGAFYRDVHIDHGVEMLLESHVERIEGAGRVERVVLAGGRAIDCDAVVVGIGAAPRVDLAREAGIFVDNGVLVDGRLQTGVPGVFAAGDIASVPHPLYGGRRIRVEHWANALDQGPAAAKAMLGSSDVWRRVPYFFSDQYDVGMEFAGDRGSADRVVLRGDLASREFIAFWLSGDRLVAGMNVNVWDVSDPIQTLISHATHVEDAKLADPDVSLEELAAAA